MKIRNLEFQKSGALSLLQFSTEEQNSLEYISSENAIKNKFIEVSEIDGQGSVNNLFVLNHSDKFVFFMDGDILIGAKQNRVLNTSVFLAPKSKTIVPVSCVEAGRWRYSSDRFSPTDYVAPSDIRYSKSKSINENMDKSNKYYADQGKVWDIVNNSIILNKSKSATSNLSDVYEHKRKDFDKFLVEFKQNKDANGVAIFVKKNMLCADIFNRCDIFEEYFPKILKGVALESYNLEKEKEEMSKAEAEYKTDEFFDSYENINFNVAKSIGVGEQRRFESMELTGFELNYNNKPVHITVLNLNKE